jgi:hypothetical protein
MARYRYICKAQAHSSQINFNVTMAISVSLKKFLPKKNAAIEGIFFS